MKLKTVDHKFGRCHYLIDKKCARSCLNHVLKAKYQFESEKSARQLFNETSNLNLFVSIWKFPDTIQLKRIEGKFPPFDFVETK